MSAPVVDHVPEGLATKTTLLKQGLRPGGEPAATWRWYKHRGGDSGWQNTPLFRIDEAVPPTPEELDQERAARREGARARRQAKRDLEAAVLTRYQGHHAETVALFRQWARSPDAVVLDTETTGLEGHIIEIAVCTVAGEVLLNTLVRNAVPIEEGAQRVHGITEEMLRTAPTFPFLAPHIRDVVRGKTALIYNADFDFRRLRATRRAHGLEKGVLGRSATACVMEAYAVLHGDYDPESGDYTWVSLARACGAMGVTPQGQAHRAAGDALTTAALIRAVAGRDWPVPQVAPPGMLAEILERR
ncbi:3'-5' exonuclease [Deinococcus sp. NW-56]|uniref:3'-5' exonuclease n=1 Tax=Deinococcus sp. NW-56 TaxID=2080419 RepID=UPI00131A0FE7|nr:3'-5' exonuclease [Deinococcus sp. NW-56]